MDGITFTQSLNDCTHQCREIIVAVYVRRVFLHRVRYFQDSRVFACLCVHNTNTFIVFHGKVYILKDFLAFTARAKNRYRDCHTCKNCKEYEYYV